MVRCRHLVKNSGEMMNKTNLIGYSYSLEEGKLARDDGRLLSLRVETSLACNMRCRYCAWDSGVPLTDEIGFDTLKRFISDGIEKGIRSVIIIGGGEPTIYKHFRELVEFIDSKGIIPVVITNGLTVTPEFSTFLYEHNCSVLLKNDSFDEETHLLCVDLTRQDYPTDKDILVPYVCTTCGETTWKTKSKTEKDK